MQATTYTGGVITAMHGKDKQEEINLEITNCCPEYISSVVGVSSCSDQKHLRVSFVKMDSVTILLFVMLKGGATLQLS